MEWVKILIPILSIILIFTLEIFAMYHNLNGTCLSISIGAIAGLGGYGLKGLFTYLKK